jgi:hypothetical protein
MSLEVNKKNIKTNQVITSSQLQNLIASPVELIQPQGSGMVTVPFSVFMELNYGTTPYINLTSNLALLMNGNNIFPAQPIPSAFLGATQNVWVYYLFYQSDTSGLNSADTDNQSVYLGNTGPLDFLLGDGTVSVNIEWSTYNL